MFKKRFATITSATLLILGASLLLITPPLPAHAGAGEPNVPVCSDVPDYTTALIADSRYNKETIAFAVFKREFSGPFLNGKPGIAVIWDVNSNPNQLTISDGKSPSHVGLSLGSAGTSFIINGDGTLTDANRNDYGANDINCVSAAHKVDFTGYTGGIDFPDPLNEGTGEIDSPPNEPCDWFDLVCVVQKVYLSVTNGFTNLMTWLGGVSTEFVGPIIEAIIPGADNNTIFTDMFNSIKTSMDAKLGFLTYPFEWFGSFFANVQEISWTGRHAPSCIPHSQGLGTWIYCELTFPVWQGQNLTIDFGAMEKSLPTVWNISIIFIRFAFFIGIIEMLRRAYFRTVKD